MNFSETLYTIRKQKKLSQKKLAEIANVSQASINYWEKGQRTPSIEAIEKLANALDVPTSQLLGEDYMIDDGFIFTFDNENDLKEVGQKKLIFPTKRKTLLDAFSQLNTDGQDKVIEYTEDILENSKYKKDPGNDNQDQE